MKTPLLLLITCLLFSFGTAFAGGHAKRSGYSISIGTQGVYLGAHHGHRPYYYRHHYPHHYRHYRHRDYPYTHHYYRPKPRLYKSHPRGYEKSYYRRYCRGYYKGRYYRGRLIRHGCTIYFNGRHRTVPHYKIIR
jgi:hypothetical protein